MDNDGPLTGRQFQALQSRNTIFDTAIALIKKNGFDKTAIKDICSEAGVSIGTFYYYFSSKQDILFELYSRADAFFTDRVRIIQAMENPIEQIKSYMALYIEFVHHQGVDMCRNLYIPQNKLFLKKDRAMLLLLENIIKKGQDSKAISKRMNPEEWVSYIFSILRGIAFDWTLHAGSYDIREYAKHHINAVELYLTFSDAALG